LHDFLVSLSKLAKSEHAALVNSTHRLASSLQIDIFSFRIAAPSSPKAAALFELSFVIDNI